MNIKDLNASIADYFTYREGSRTFADVAIWDGRSVTVTEFADPERVDGISATFRLFPMLGVHPVLGRGFTEKDNEDGSPDVVLLSHGYWQRRFRGDPKVIGRRIRADGAAREIVGVLPQGLWFMDMRHDLVLPLRFNRAKYANGSTGDLDAKLREQIALTVAQANSCEYCLSAHSAIGGMVGLKPEEIAASREAHSHDARREAGLQFAQTVVVSRGEVSDDALARVRGAGYTDGEITEIVAIVAVNIFTNYFNHVARTDVDFPRVTVTLPAAAAHAH